MSEQIFISYRRVGGDVCAKLICEALKNRGFSVFYDYDSIHGGYFDTRIIDAIGGCSDFVLVLSRGSLDRCESEDDWVRQEIVTALGGGKNIIPIMLEGFEFPKELPEAIAPVSRINGIPFSMPFFDAMIGTVVDRLRARPAEMKAADGNRPAATADESFEFELGEDGCYTVRYVGRGDRTVVIPSRHEGHAVTRLGKRAFYDAQALDEVVIPEGVTEIGAEAFSYCKSLQRVSLPESLEVIGISAFKRCQSLKRIEIPEGVTLIDEEAFYGCTLLSEINLPKGLRRISALSMMSTAVREVMIPFGVEAIEAEAFWGCKSLETLILPDGVKAIGARAFCECESLTTVEFGHELEDIDTQAFYLCTSLKKIKLHRGVRRIGSQAFAKCHGRLKVVYLWSRTSWKQIKRERGCLPLFAEIIWY